MIALIVTPDTLRRWIRESKKPGGIKKTRKGRPRTKEENCSSTTVEWQRDGLEP